jgi:hypothetical protein
MLENVWEFLNSPIGLLLVTGLLAYIGKLIVTRKPAWMELANKYSGDLIAAVKYAEKAIPDNSPNTSVRRLDEAMKYFIKVTGMTDTPLLQEQVRQAIQTTHNEMELVGQIPGLKPTTLGGA